MQKIKNMLKFLIKLEKSYFWPTLMLRLDVNNQKKLNG